MTKLILTMAAGSALLLVSCEPIPVHGHPRPRPYPHPDRHQPYPDRHQQQPHPDDRQFERPYGGETEVVRPPTRDQYPVAERTANPNHVISPYSPYNVINVQGFRSGQLAKDPSNDKIFRIP